ncbi:MAG: hypothetical protein JXN61_11780, partial [Sedimentisphaerales bacterium]|nr:hypothetical protein [Sedimentisphaerales bacterium]
LTEFGIGSDNPGRLGAAVSEQFAPMDPNRNLGKLREYGAVPWWTYDGLWVRFWRPLASFTHWLDYRIFGSSPVAMHAHNIVWLAAVVFLVTILYSRLNGPAWMAALAGLLFVLDDFTYFPAMWIANRNIFLSLFFGILCVLWHHRWRDNGSPTAAVVSAAFLVGSLLSAEAGVATCAYLFAYAVTLEQGNFKRRAASLAPAILVTIGWRLFYNKLGHGASGGSFYLDPSLEPLRYAWATLVRGPILLMRQWSRVSADTFSCVPVSTRMILWPIVVVMLLVIILLLWPLLKSNRHARFWAVGMHVSVLPICATMPMNRNLLWVGIGACGLVGHFLGGVAANESWIPQRFFRRFLTKALAVSIIFVHLPMALLVRIISPATTVMLVNVVKRTMQVDSSYATAPSNLNLIFLLASVCALVALSVSNVVQKRNLTPWQRSGRRLAKGLFIALIIVYMPVVFVERVAMPFLARGKEPANTDQPVTEFAGKQLIVVNAPNPASFFYMPFARAYEGLLLPRAIRVLAPAFAELEVTRLDDNTLKVRAKYGNLLTCKPERILDMDVVYMLEAISSVRSNGNGLNKGEKVVLPEMSAEIVELDDKSLPVAVIFKFDVSLDDSSLTWVQWSWKQDQYFQFNLPPIGEKARVRGPF